MTKDKEIDSYLFEDNVQRLCLFDMLRRKKYLQSLTLTELDNLVSEVNKLTNNLQHKFERGMKMIPVSDEHSWAGNSLFRDIFVHTVLDLESEYEGSEKMFKNKLKKRWEDADKIREVTKKV